MKTLRKRIKAAVAYCAHPSRAKTYIRSEPCFFLLYMGMPDIIPGRFGYTNKVMYMFIFNDCVHISYIHIYIYIYIYIHYVIIYSYIYMYICELMCVLK